MNVPISHLLVELSFQPQEFFDTQYHLAQASALRRRSVLAEVGWRREGQ